MLHSVFAVKRILLRWAGLKIAKNVRIAGPLYFSNVSNISIGDGIWICTRAAIVNSVTVGGGCVIAAGTVVINDVEANTLIAGVPGRKRKTYSS